MTGETHESHGDVPRSQGHEPIEPPIAAESDALDVERHSAEETEPTQTEAPIEPAELERPDNELSPMTPTAEIDEGQPTNDTQEEVVPGGDQNPGYATSPDDPVGSAGPTDDSEVPAPQIDDDEPSGEADPGDGESEETVVQTTVDDGQDEPAQDGGKDWYILKVQSNREDSIRDALLRRAKIADLERHFGDVIVPTETVTEFKNGKKKVVKRKLYPGYIVVNMEINDDTWFLVRDTHGIGDFTGAGGKPVPLLDHEVSKLLARQEEKTEEAPKLKIAFKPGDRVKINEGTFENFEGDVDSIDETNGRVTVMINIFGRSTPVELEYWQIAAV